MTILVAIVVLAFLGSELYRSGLRQRVALTQRVADLELRVAAQEEALAGLREQLSAQVRLDVEAGQEGQHGTVS